MTWLGCMLRFMPLRGMTAATRLLYEAALDSSLRVLGGLFLARVWVFAVWECVLGDSSGRAHIPFSHALCAFVCAFVSARPSLRPCWLVSDVLSSLRVCLSQAR